MTRSCAVQLRWNSKNCLCRCTHMVIFSLLEHVFLTPHRYDITFSFNRSAWQDFSGQHDQFSLYTSRQHFSSNRPLTPSKTCDCFQAKEEVYTIYGDRRWKWWESIRRQPRQLRQHGGRPHPSGRRQREPEPVHVESRGTVGPEQPHQPGRDGAAQSLDQRGEPLRQRSQSLHAAEPPDATRLLRREAASSSSPPPANSKSRGD